MRVEQIQTTDTVLRLTMEETGLLRRFLFCMVNSGIPTARETLFAREVLKALSL